MGTCRGNELPSLDDQIRARERAIERLTMKIANASNDDEIDALVDERRAMRAELEALRRERAGVPSLADERSKRGRST
jgi:hypothetical protein